MDKHLTPDEARKFYEAAKASKPERMAPFVMPASHGKRVCFGHRGTVWVDARGRPDEAGRSLRVSLEGHPSLGAFAEAYGLSADGDLSQLREDDPDVRRTVMLTGASRIGKSAALAAVENLLRKGGATVLRAPTNPGAPDAAFLSPDGRRMDVDVGPGGKLRPRAAPQRLPEGITVRHDAERKALVFAVSKEVAATAEEAVERLQEAGLTVSLPAGRRWDETVGEAAPHTAEELLDLLAWAFPHACNWIDQGLSDGRGTAEDLERMYHVEGLLRAAGRLA